ncbi:unnamed protein product [Anisakis simplex]|uniref:YscJ_FliF_C domain-containing protein n=1 Tax=Anisakis simplex TaxID=6269 RepID=A0A0M3J5H7_ANISI|nr:unnamed protein product [Anisakis simplex]
MKRRSQSCILVSVVISVLWIVLMTNYISRLDYSDNERTAAAALIKREKFNAKFSYNANDKIKYDEVDVIGDKRKDVKNKEVRKDAFDMYDNKNAIGGIREKVMSDKSVRLSKEISPLRFESTATNVIVLTDGGIDKSIAGQMKEEQLSQNQIPEVDLQQLAIIKTDEDKVCIVFVFPFSAFIIIAILIISFINDDY